MRRRGFLLLQTGWLRVRVPSSFATYTLGGFTDATFTAIKVIEDGCNATWPF